MRDFGEAFSIKLINTAAESPWSNGTVERLNGVLGKLVLKILDDVNCETDIALAWAVAARNAYYNNSGYSPNQLVFGFNPSMPDIYNSKLPGLNKITASEMIAKLIEAKRVAMEEFVKFDSCDRIKRALSSNIRRTIIDDLQIGDEVYYKRNNSDTWHGPAKVILIERQVITVKHGGVTVKANTVSLVKVPHICTKECEIKENDSGLTGKSTNSETARNSSIPIRDADDKIEGNLPSCSKAGSYRKRKQESEDTDNRKKTKTHEDSSTRSWRSGERFQGIDSVTGEYFIWKNFEQSER